MTDVNLDHLTFEYYQVILLLLSLVAVISLLQYIFYFTDKPRTEKVANLVKTYVVIEDTWNVFYTFHHAFLSMVLWNNTVPFFGYNDTLTAYK